MNERPVIGTNKSHAIGGNVAATIPYTEDRLPKFANLKKYRASKHKAGWQPKKERNQ